MLIVRPTPPTSHSNTYPDDSNKVSQEALNDFDALSEKLIADYGMPTYIFSTPYAVSRRCLKSLALQTSVNADPEVGKYNNKYDARLTEGTQQDLAVFDIDRLDFEDRIRHRLKRLIQISTKHTIWVVTHPEVIQCIAKLKNRPGVEPNAVLIFRTSVKRSEMDAHQREYKVSML
jgi:hypothetical protein